MITNIRSIVEFNSARWGKNCVGRIDSIYFTKDLIPKEIWCEHFDDAFFKPEGLVRIIEETKTEVPEPPARKFEIGQMVKNFDGERTVEGRISDIEYYLGGDTPSWEIFYKLQGPEIYWDEFISEEGISPL